MRIHGWTLAVVMAGPVLAGGTTAGAQEPSEPSVVTVTGEGVIRRAPEVARVVFAAESRDASPRQAQRAAAAAMASVHDRLGQAGIPEEAMRTLSYELSPEYEFVENRRSLKGYVARNRLDVRVDSIDRVGEILDVGVEAGATSVEGLHFDLKDRAAAERAALQAATADAWARARAAAAGVDRMLARVVRIEEAGVPTTIPRAVMAMRAPAQAESPPPILAGDLEIRATVTLTAELR